MTSDRSVFLDELTTIIKNEAPITLEMNMFDGLIEAKDVCLFVTPIDNGAPKGRMILPQTQALRSILDKNATAIFTQLTEYKETLSKLSTPPKLVVADSQVIKEVIELSDKRQ